MHFEISENASCPCRHPSSGSTSSSIIHNQSQSNSRAFFTPSWNPPTPFIDRKPEIHKRHLAFPEGFSPKLPDGPGIQRRNFGKKLLGIKRIGRAVCGGVVDQDKTVDRPCLAQETIQTFQQEVLAVISHKNYKNFLGVSGDSSPIQRLLSDSASCKLFLSGLASFIKMNPPKEKVALRSHSTLF